MTLIRHIVVTADPLEPRRGTLTCGPRTFPCVLGRSGVALDKREGDGATPLGLFPLRRVVYRLDRLTPPQTSLPIAAIAREDGWCDAPGDARYNQPVTLPYGASAESMWREDTLYDLVVVIGHNDSPVAHSEGSAIFMHVAPADGGPTAGCVALARSDLLWVLREVAPDAVIEIRKS